MYCRVLVCARSSFYYRGDELDEKKIRAAIKAVAGEWPTYGRRRVTVQLRRQGWTVNPKRVGRLMRAIGLQAKTRRKVQKTTDSAHGFPRCPNLVQGLVALSGLMKSGYRTSSMSACSAAPTKTFPVSQPASRVGLSRTLRILYPRLEFEASAPSGRGLPKKRAGPKVGSPVVAPYFGFLQGVTAQCTFPAAYFWAIAFLINPMIAIRIAPPTPPPAMLPTILVTPIAPPPVAILNSPSTCLPAAPPTIPAIELPTVPNEESFINEPAMFPPRMPHTSWMINGMRLSITLLLLLRLLLNVDPLPGRQSVSASADGHPLLSAATRALE